MAQKTLNQIISNLSNITHAHDQLETFYFGDPYEFATSGTTKYPALVVDLRAVHVVRNQIRYDFDFFFLDRTSRGEVNETEVLSDLVSVAKDINAELKHPSWSFDVDFGAEFTLEPVTEHMDDILAGYKMGLTISIDYPDDTCRIPFNTSILNRQ